MSVGDHKRVLVTGGAGFLGSYVVSELRRRGVVQIVVPRSREWDLTDRAAVRSLFENYKPNLVVHLAAVVGGIGANQANPGRFFYDNLMMGVNLIDESRKWHVRKFVQVGTVCAYPKVTPVPFAEGSLWDGYPEETNAPYGVAKKALLTMLHAYREQYGLHGIYLLPANLYGPGDNFDLDTSHVIPALIRKCVEAKQTGGPVEVWGTGSPTREFLHVHDAARGVVLALERYDKSEPVNLGTGSEISISSLVALIAQIVGYQGEVKWNATRPDGQPRRCLDTTRAKHEFGFEARISLENGLSETVEHFSKLFRNP